MTDKSLSAGPPMARGACFPERRWPLRLAVLLSFLTFPLIWVGGLVTTYDAGMAVPDWPSTYGYNLFLYPYQTWLFGPWDLFIEHGHRLLGALVGVITIALVVVVFKRDGRRWLRNAAVVGLVLVILQGCLGGARVLLDERQLAMIHGCGGPAFFAYCVALAVFVSRFWQDSSRQIVCPQAVWIRRLVLVTVGLAYLQLILGAQLRHIPVTAPRLTFNINLILHLTNAFLLTASVILVGLSLRRIQAEPALRRPSFLLLGLCFVQLGLGSATWIVKYGWPYWFVDLHFAAAHTIQAKSWWQATTATLHMAVGSLILGTAVLLAVRVFRVLKVKAAGVRSEVMMAGTVS